VTRLLGLDIGTHRIGVAVSDALGITAQRLTVIERHDLATDVSAIVAVMNQHAVKGIVVGLPLTMQGRVGEQAKLVMAFVEQLRTHLDCPVHMVDERLTTVQGERALVTMDTSRRKRKRLIDQVAAQLILQTYLDAKR